MNEQDILKKLQENLAKDLVHFEENDSITENQLDEITETYSKVYDILTNIKSLWWAWHRIDWVKSTEMDSPAM